MIVIHVAIVNYMLDIKFAYDINAQEIESTKWFLSRHDFSIDTTKHWERVKYQIEQITGFLLLYYKIRMYTYVYVILSIFVYTVYNIWVFKFHIKFYSLYTYAKKKYASVFTYLKYIYKIFLKFSSQKWIFKSKINSP